MIFGYFRRPGFQISGVGLLIGGSVDGLCLCVWLCCGWVVAKVAGSFGFPLGFFFFFSSVVTLVFFFFLIWVFVPVGFW